MNVGDLVRRKPYKGGLNSYHAPTYYGIVSCVYPNGLCKVVFILKGGDRKVIKLSETDLEPISKAK